MNIKLDDDQWQAASTATLGDILADVSDRAHAKSRIVATVMLDRRRITDRDIDPAFLREPSAKFSNLVATSVTHQDIIQTVRGSVDRYRGIIAMEGQSLIGLLRSGNQDFGPLDRWLGKVADVLEFMGNGASDQADESGVRAIGGWIEELLVARRIRDTVRMADVLEYEILPRLSA